MELLEPVSEKRYEDKYGVTKSGKVWNYKTKKYLLPSPNTSDYLCVQLCSKGKRVCRLVHRLVALTFLPNPQGYPVINHKDGNRHNNNLENLEWTTPIGNVTHSIRSGLHTPWKITPKKLVAGRNAGLSRRKLTEKQVAGVRKAYATGKFTQREIGNYLGVAHNTISDIIRGRTYAVNETVKERSKEYAQPGVYNPGG